MRFIRNIIIIPTLLVCLVILCACQFSPNHDTTTGTTTESTTGQSPYYSVEKYGIQLTVKFDKPVIQQGKNLILTAIVKNTRNSAIQYTLPSSTDNMHNEIIVKIADSSSGKEFIDADIFGRVETAMEKTVTLKSGESFTEVITFVPGYRTGGSWEILKDAKLKYFEAGEYAGTAQFEWNRKDGNSAVLEYLKLNFNVTIQ